MRREEEEDGVCSPVCKKRTSTTANFEKEPFSTPKSKQKTVEKYAYDLINTPGPSSKKKMKALGLEGAEYAHRLDSLLEDQPYINPLHTIQETQDDDKENSNNYYNQLGRMAAPEKPKNPFTQSIGPIEMMNYQRGRLDGEQISPREINFSQVMQLNDLQASKSGVTEGFNSPLESPTFLSENNQEKYNNNIFTQNNMNNFNNSSKINRQISFNDSNRAQIQQQSSSQQQLHQLQNKNALVEFFGFFNLKNEEIANLFCIEAQFEVINSSLSSNVAENIIQLGQTFNQMEVNTSSINIETQQDQFIVNLQGTAIGEKYNPMQFIASAKISIIDYKISHLRIQFQ